MTDNIIKFPTNKLKVNNLTGKVTSDRLIRIRSSLERINKLMEELRKLSNQDKSKEDLCSNGS